MALRKTVGLVLGCGSSRGWAHIGAIEALEDARIPIDLIVGVVLAPTLALSMPAEVSKA